MYMLYFIILIYYYMCMMFLSMQTYVRLNPLMLTVHRRTLLRVQSCLAKLFDRDVLIWKTHHVSELENALLQVCISTSTNLTHIAFVI